MPVRQGAGASGGYPESFAHGGIQDKMLVGCQIACLLDLTIVGGLQQLFNAASAERVAAYQDSRLAFWRRGIHRVIFVTDRALIRTDSGHGRHCY